MKVQRTKRAKQHWGEKSEVGGGHQFLISRLVTQLWQPVQYSTDAKTENRVHGTDETSRNKLAHMYDGSLIKV